MPRFDGEAFDYEGETAQAVNLIESAKAVGVPQFVHTSASGIGQHTEHPGWAEDRWAGIGASLGAKTAIQDRLRVGGFPYWTLLKPGFFMENFLLSMAFLFPRGIDGGLVSVLKPETRLSLAAVDDIGTAAAAAISDPERFNGLELEFASDYRSMTEIAEILSRVLGARLTAPDMTVEQAIAAGLPVMGAGHDFMNVIGQPARPEFARDLGIPLTSFEDWAQTHMP
jgi:uncharacterized protein YbjT (DUF2867 family)